MNPSTSLNPQQREAVETTRGPMLILAGAGSGKTRVIVHRIAHLIREQVPPSRIIAVTFTNKAANEMKERLSQMLGESGKGVHLSTFHSLGVRILRETIDLLGYHKNFVIYDSQDQLALIRNLMDEEGISESPLIDPKSAQQMIHHAKTRGTSPEELLVPNALPRTRLAGQLYRQYQETLKGCNALDFEDILNFCLKLFESHAEKMQEIRDRFRYVMVDEYQDTNSVQYRLLKHLVRDHRNLCVVGDDDQSIYGWRGAEPGNLFQFEKDFPDVKVVRLEQNYRSTEVILKAANALIENNSQRMPKTLWSEKPGGELLGWIEAEDEVLETETVVRRIRLDIMRHNRKLEEYCILYRSNFQSRVLEESLREAKLPYRVVGGKSFFERKEIRDALAYLKLIQNPNDLVSLQRVINTPRRGIGKTSLMQLNACVAETSLPVLKIMSQARKYSSIPAEAASSMEVFSALLGDFQGRFEKGNLGEVFRELLDELGYLRFLEQQSGDVKSREKRIQVVQELLRGAQRYAEDHPENQLGDYLERMMLFSENDDQDGSTSQALTLMTLHSAKGLEFPYVYMVGMSEGLFPNPRALDDDAEEEERRLCYVGITRAQRELVFSMAKTRKRYQETMLQEPSRFLMELDPKLFSTPVIGEASLEQKGKMKKRSRSDFFQNLKQFNSQS